VIGGVLRQRSSLATAGGFSVLSANGEFLMKDIALLGLALWLLVASISATQQRQAPHA
jgi:uncharacterized membrane protein YkgB